MDFSMLPDHVLLQIFRYLPFEDRVRAGRVNSATFRRISKLAVSETKTLHFRSYVFGGTFNKQRRFTPQSVSALLNLCASSLEEVRFDLSSVYTAEDAEQQRLLETFSDFHCPNLNTLYCKEGGAEIMHAILRNCPNLVHLVSARRHYITFSHPSDVTTSEKLQVLRCYCDVMGFRSLTGRVPNLKNLHVETSWFKGSPSVVVAMDRFFSTVPNLERLVITTSDNVTCLHLEEQGGERGMNSLWRLNRLTEFTVACKLTDQDHVHLEDHVLAKVAAGSFPRLRVLDLEVNGGITVRGLTLLAGSLPDLRELTFASNYPSLTDLSAGIRALAAKCGHLEKLRFTRFGPSLRPHVLAELLHSCPRLSQVDACDVVVGLYDPDEAGSMLESLATAAVLEKGRSITITLHTRKKRRGRGVWRSASVVKALEKLKADHGVTVEIELANITEPSDESFSDLEGSSDEESADLPDSEPEDSDMEEW